jgi:adenylyl- and sulfurtransferase ThiI
MMNHDIILVRYGELSLKSSYVRKYFVSILVRNIKKSTYTRRHTAQYHKGTRQNLSFHNGSLQELFNFTKNFWYCFIQSRSSNNLRYRKHIDSKPTTNQKYFNKRKKFCDSINKDWNTHLLYPASGNTDR